MPAVAELPDLDEAEPTTAVEVPFWQKYNAHFEFPSSVVLSVLAFVTLFAVIIGVLLLALAGAPDRKPVPIQRIVGNDDTGDGSAGSGGEQTPIALGNSQPTPAPVLDQPTRPDLPDVKNPMPSPTLVDPTAPGQVTERSNSSWEQLERAIREGNAGGRQGSGQGKGSGSDPTPGAGPGGDGVDNTRKRSLRWSLRFVAAGREYLEQLAAMKAVIVVPLPPDEKDAMVFRDLRNPKGSRMADDEWTKLAGQIQFLDTEPKSVRGVADALGMTQAPRRFYAFFPRELEEDLARKETGYRNRKAEDIAETVFRVTVRGGQYDIAVAEQTPKR